MTDTENALHSELDDLSPLQGTPFDVIPIRDIASEAEIEAYNENPLVVELQRYKIPVDPLTQEAKDRIEEQNERTKRALLYGDTEEMKNFVNSQDGIAQITQEKLASLIDGDGKLPIGKLEKISHEDPDQYTISFIYTPCILNQENHPIVALKGVNRDILRYIPAVNLPKIWQDSTLFLNHLKPIGRLADIKQ